MSSCLSFINNTLLLLTWSEKSAGHGARRQGSRSRIRGRNWDTPRTGKQGCGKRQTLNLFFFPSSSHLFSLISCNIAARCKNTSRNPPLSLESSAALQQISFPLTITILLPSLFLSITFTAPLFLCPITFYWPHPPLIGDVKEAKGRGGVDERKQGNGTTVEWKQIKRWIWIRGEKMQQKCEKEHTIFSSFISATFIAKQYEHT